MPDMPVRNTLTHEEMLRTSGYDLCSPISGSMRPMVRQRRDSLLFVRPEGRLRKYDVALYRSGGRTVMHRVIRVKPDGYIIRGDNAREKEYVRDEQIIGVMKGFYRDENYIPAEDRRYRRYARLIVAVQPILPLVRKGRRLLRRIRKK